MIWTVGLNLSVDRTLEVERFVYGGMNRVERTLEDAGGKAVNVAVAAAELGERASVTGFLRKDSREIFERRLRKAGVGMDFVEIEGRARVNVKLMDRQGGQVSELNERGEPVSEDQLAALREKLRVLLREGDILVLSGALPPSCPAGFYASLMREARSRGCLCALDAEGAAFQAGVAEKPFLIKPNRYELEMAAGRELKGLEEVKRAAMEFTRGGVGVACVSLGDQGALIAGAREAFYAQAVKVQVRSTVGAGDTMLAAVVSGLSRGEGLDEALRMGVACATSCVMSEGTRLVDGKTYRQILAKTNVQRV